VRDPQHAVAGDLQIGVADAITLERRAVTPGHVLHRTAVTSTAGREPR
jgi:hypothetical protein